MSTAPKTLADYQAPYPEATPNQKRYVIFLEEKDYDSELEEYKLQLIPGRVMKVDPVNRCFIAGSVKEKTIPGWGYNYYVVEMGPMATTLMAVPPGSPPVRKFVPMAERPFIPYNSKLPVVVYMPKEGELHYRVWTPTKPKEEIAGEQ
ncbi:ecotin [Trypanosoma cruzi]|nr:ecotin [Trypanosoma cruzi]